MTLEGAINNIKLIISQYKGTLAEHQALQESINLISMTLQPQQSASSELQPAVVEEPTTEETQAG